MMANEYSNKTIKQNLIDGLSKKEFILSKFLTGNFLFIGLHGFRICGIDDFRPYLFRLQ